MREMRISTIPDMSNLLAAAEKFKGMSTLESVGDDHLLKYKRPPVIQVLENIDWKERHRDVGLGAR